MTPDQWERYRTAGREYTGYLGLRRSGLTAAFFARLGGDAVADVLRWALFLNADFAHQPGVCAGRTADDATAALRMGRTALYLSLESANAIGSDLENLELLFGAGIRCIGLTYDAPNALGSGLGAASDQGLTRFGHEAVRLMNALGILVDLGHVGDRTSLDAIAASRRPPVISHAGARSVWPTPRMKPDDVLKALAEADGVIGIEAAPHSSMTPGSPHTLESVMAHFEYCANLMGIDHVAFGPDTMFGDHVGLHHLHPLDRPEPDYPRSPYVDGIENPGEAFHRIAAWLSAHGYPEHEMAQVLGGNVLRVMRAAGLGGCA
jgi:membrane dipeptidase